MEIRNHQNDVDCNYIIIRMFEIYAIPHVVVTTRCRLDVS